jgi:hypothetical protein
MENAWQPVAIAPAGFDLELSIYDNGKYHALVFPCQREGSRWRDVRAHRSMRLEPSHWRFWDHKRD